MRIPKKFDHAHILQIPKKNCYPPKDEDWNLRKSGLEKIFETILMLIVYNWVPIKHQQDQLSPEEFWKKPPGQILMHLGKLYIYIIY